MKTLGNELCERASRARTALCALQKFLRGTVRPALATAALATAALATLIGCSGRDDPPAPNTLTITAGANIVAVVGRSAPAIPTVALRDQRGQPIANVIVRWVVVAGEGVVLHDSTTTDVNGIATCGGWTFGVRSGKQVLEARAAGVATAVFNATATPGSVKRLQRLSPATQQVVVNSAVPSPPSIRVYDQFDNVVPGVAVTFSVDGRSIITGAQKITDTVGEATADAWVLSDAAGMITAKALAQGFDTATFFSVTAIGGAPISVGALAHDMQAGETTVSLTGVANFPSCLQPSVKFVDAFGNPAGGGVATFTAGPNSGTVLRPTGVSDKLTGVASAGAWILGTAPVQTLIATSSTSPGKTVTFTATLVQPGASSAFNICVRFVGDGGTARHREAVTKAVTRWRQVITGHVATSHLSALANDCTNGIPAIDEDVSDLLVYVQITSIDGPKGVLGQAAPCYLHSPQQLTMMGFFQLDQADLDLLQTEGTLDDVVLHEMGHILGVGSLWSSSRALLVGRGGNNPRFVGAQALEQFKQVGGATYTGIPVPVENTGAGGTRDTHWRRTVFRNELMQGFASPGGMPLSRVTIGSLADLGYQVNVESADAYSIIQAIVAGASSMSPGAQHRELGNDVVSAPLWGVERNGRKTLLKPRGFPY